MKQTLLLVAVLALPGGILAQNETPPGSAEAATKPDPSARLTKLREELGQKFDKWLKKRDELVKQAETAKAEGKPIPAIPMQPPMQEFLKGFAKAAEDYKGTADAVPFLVEVADGAGDSEMGMAALTTLIANHAASPALSRLGREMSYWPQMLGKDEAKAAFAKISSATKDPNVAGWIAFAKHKGTIENAATSSEAYLAARGELMALTVTDPELKSEIQGTINVREKFGLGNVAADIKGVDLDGVEFSLSDYKGKVVFLDFWGDW